MNATGLVNTRQILTLAREAVDIYRNPAEQARVRDSIDHQVAVERYLMGQESFVECSSEIMREVRNHITELDTRRYGAELDHAFFDPSVVQATQCLVGSIIQLSDSSLQSNTVIREWFTNLRRVGGETSNGYAFRADLDTGTGSIASFMVLKTPRRLDRQRAFDEIRHEAVVGKCGVNQLRYEGVPNFVLIYGTLACSIPFLSVTKLQVASWCEADGVTEDHTTYLLCENIPTLYNMRNFLESPDFNLTTFTQYLLQLAFALRAAYFKCGFTHYDLHDENVLIRPVSREPFYLKYAGPGGDYWILSPGNVATIIDYGMSHIEVDVNGVREHLGTISTNMEQFGIYRHRAHPLSDIYKLLCFCLIRMRHGSAFNSICKLLTFFDSVDSIDQILEDQQAVSFHLPLTPLTVLATLDDFIRFILQTLPCKDLVSTTAPTKRVLNCSHGQCATDVFQVLTHIGLADTLEKPQTFFHLFDVITRYRAEMTNSARSIQTRQDTADRATQILKSFDIVQATELEATRLRPIFEMVRRKIAMLPSNWTPESAVSYRGSVELFQFTQEGLRILDAYYRLLSIRDTLNYLAPSFTYPPAVRLVEVVNKAVQECQDQCDRIRFLVGLIVSSCLTPRLEMTEFFQDLLQQYSGGSREEEHLKRLLEIALRLHDHIPPGRDAVEV